MTKHIFIAQLDVPAEHEEEFNRLYDGEHVPNLLAVPGVISGTRYKLAGSETEGMPRYLAIYELESPDIPESDAWKKAATTDGWVEVRQHVSKRLLGAFSGM
jgi:hypothetical protein